mmetsp:Transcript_19615/g.27378  ORF Transcript_19615/g.27378 Transcript_19615/m.27378 type:complete len:533 (-) Transcript_19615:20-1618(-)
MNSGRSSIASWSHSGSGNSELKTATLEDFDPEHVCNSLSGMWSGWSGPYTRPESKTLWQDCQLRFEPDIGPMATVTGVGYSLWRGERIEFTLTGTLHAKTWEVQMTKIHKGKFSSSVLYNAIISPAKMELNGSYSTGRLCLHKTNKFTQNSQKQQNLKTDKDLSIKMTTSKEVSMWEGQSVNEKRGDVTVWKQCSLRFENTKSGKSSFIKGVGVSVWRRKEIPFRIEGTYDSKTGSGSLVKTHTGERIKSSVAYEMSIDFVQERITGKNPASNFTLYKCNGRSSGARQTQNVSSHQAGCLPEYGRLPSYGQGYTSSLQGHSSQDEFTYAPFLPECANLNDEPGVASPYSAYGLANYDGLSEIVKLTPSSCARTSELQYGNLFDTENYAPPVTELPIKPASSMTSPHVSPSDLKTNNGIEKYKAFLQGIVLSKKLSSGQLQALSDFRIKHEISTDDHENSLKQIGLTVDAFEKMKVSEDDVDDKELCKICYEREMNCTLVPCGHMVCMQCSGRIKRCPHCRVSFQRVQKLFRS